MRKFHNNDPPQTTLKHLASIDFEDWYNDVEKSTQLDYRESQQAFRRQIRKITEILDQTQTRCTFFVLGKTAERYPNLVQELQHKGHEIASHGYGHEKVFNLTPREFEEDIKKSIEIIDSLIREKPVGYRAPFFSVNKDQFWIYDILSKHGFLYSSSIFPFNGIRYGTGSHPLTPQKKVLSDKQEITEFPLSVVNLRKTRFPVAGGGFWRVMPVNSIKWSVQYIQKQNRPFNMYLHPHEFDPSPLKSHKGWKRNLYVNLGRKTIHKKFQYLLTRFPFSTFKEYLLSSS